LVGVVPLGVGAFLVSWALAGHYQNAPGKSWAIDDLTPEYLLTGGPYCFTRNPMYVGAMAMWAGWAILLGSGPVIGGVVVLTAGARLAVAWEEKKLAARWGEEWISYAARTPRWLGWPLPAG
jgi:protein-S-isoprenylcysteine O-methyltransferase Ste14